MTAKMQHIATTGADPRLAGGRLTIDLDALVANSLLLAERCQACPYGGCGQG